MRTGRKSRKRLQAAKESRQQTATSVSIGAMVLIGTVGTEAAPVHVTREIPAAFQTLKDSRNRIRDFHVAQRNAREAAAALVQAEASLQSARQDQRNAAAGLASAQENLTAARNNLIRVSRELNTARQESIHRTEQAIAAQQAVADFAPQVWNQESMIQSLEADRSEVQQRYVTVQSEINGNAQQR